MALTAIGVQAVPTPNNTLKFRVRVKRHGDHAWRNAVEFGELDAPDACYALTRLGISEERAMQLVDIARSVGTTVAVEH